MQNTVVMTAQCRESGALQIIQIKTVFLYTGTIKEKENGKIKETKVRGREGEHFAGQCTGTTTLWLKLCSHAMRLLCGFCNRNRFH